MSTIFWLLIGMAIGWNFPQPKLAKVLQEKIMAFFNKKAD